MSNYKGEIKEYLASVRPKFKTDAKILKEIKKVLNDLNEFPTENRHQIMFYNQMERYLMPKESSIQTLTKAFGKPLIPKPNFGYVDVWGVGNDNGKTGYFIVMDEDGFSYIHRFKMDNNKYHNNVILAIEFNRVERFIKFVKQHQKRV